ncbi:DUF2101 family protein [Methanobacterium congolense]|uniref:DUF2101 domain-containing protein n=1 Tax=Methanobacterium congolense TaxID=118062 RepID=A0A1D3L2A3_9EURY|nr:DUF2101 family protein [Methanobacterium congolense]SCG85639.1 putative protein [Methanobacterium congolense]
MNFFNKFGDIILKVFSFVGMLILAIPKIPEKLRSIKTDDFKSKVDTDNIKENINRIRDNTKIEERVSKITTKKGESEEPLEIPKDIEELSKQMDGSEDTIFISGSFNYKEKENTILRLQILSGAFIIFSILYIFNFIAGIIYGILGILTVGYVVYLLYKRIKLMYSNDFPAYRDFFLMYIVIGLVLVVVGTNSTFVNAFSFQFFPSLTVLIFALILVAAVFLIFRIRYYRNYTYGEVVEAGKNVAYVKIEYDIRSNVKPDIYMVENSIGAVEGDFVKVKLEEKFMNLTGNKPTNIIEKVKTKF